MSDYIKREDAEKLMRYSFLGALTEEERVAQLNAIPSADVVEVKHGKWIMLGGDFQCSNCHYTVMPWNNTPYCPNCGAKMDGKEQDHE